ncbi:MAG: ABC transporter permease [Bacteroidota bacterium]
MEFEIKPRGKVNIGLNELWEYRELFYFFTWRDIKVKYKQTALGVLWAIFQPAIMTALFTLGFGKLLSANSELTMPYPVFALSGFLMWNIFSSGLSNAGNSMVNNSNIIKKIYFPRLIIPISSILVSVVDFSMAFLVFIPVLLYYDCWLNAWAFMYIPLSVLLAAMATFGLGTFLAAINIKYRDFRYILPFFIQALLFATPVIYPIKITDNRIFQWVMQLNPMNAPIELFRASIGNNVVNYQTVVISLLVSFFLFIVGVVYFRKTESYFADLA